MDTKSLNLILKNHFKSRIKKQISKFSKFYANSLFFILKLDLEGPQCAGSPNARGSV